MKWRRPDAAERARDIRRVSEVARRMLAGELAIREGARELNNLRFRVCEDELDGDFVVFVAIDSDTESLRDALELRRDEDLYRDEAIAACRRLLERFSTAE